MKRWLLTILAALSLVLCGWVVVLWMQSYGPVVGHGFGSGFAHEIMPMRGQVTITGGSRGGTAGGK